MNDEFEITVVLDDRNVELRIRVSVNAWKEFYSLKSSFLHTARDNYFVKDGVYIGFEAIW